MPGRREVVFQHGTIFDGSRFRPAGTAVRVRGGTITSVGPAAAGGRAEPVDLDGGTLLPGFIDAHVHPVFAGDQLRHCDLRAAKTARGYAELVAGYAAAHPDEEWITGGGWSLDAFPAGLPTRGLLDQVVPGRPVFLPNRDCHGAWVNSRALALAGITRLTPDPADGRIERDAGGEPTGMLQESAVSLVARLLPEPSEDDWYQALLLAQDELWSFGITAWQDAIVGEYNGGADPFPAYLRAAAAGTLRARVVGAQWWDRERGLEQVAGLVRRRGLAGAGQFRATSVKMMLDGVAENYSAAMLEPYLDRDGCPAAGSGRDFIDPGELPRYVTALDREGFGVHFHAIGDRAVRHALDAVAAAVAARRPGGGPGPRHHVAHLQVVHPDDIPRFAELGVTANMQPLWATHEPQMDELCIPFLGSRRAGWQYPFRSLRDAGTTLCAGSDWPVSSPSPLWGAHVAVNRNLPAEAEGCDAEPFLPDQALSLASVLGAYTRGSAWINGLEGVTGSIAAGLAADFAVVDADLSRLPAGEIYRAAVTQTWIGGEPVWRRG